MAAALEALGVSRSFGNTEVVRDATLTVMPGEITALVGPNGSGKTTLMLMLATLLRPDRGQVRLAGHDVATDLVRARTQLGWMPDTLGSWAQLTVRETLIAVCAMYGMRGEAATHRVSELIEHTGLGPQADQRTNTLSRGQKQRLSLARAITHRPSVLLLDEPASGLDPEARATQRHLLTALAREGVAILVASHVLDELDQLASSVVFLRDGRTEAPEAVRAALHGGQSWHIRSLDRESLEGALTTAHVEWSSHPQLGGVTHLITAQSQDEAARLLASLTAAGVPVVEFGPVRGALEQAFLQLAGGSATATSDGESEQRNDSPTEGVLHITNTPTQRAQ